MPVAPAPAAGDADAAAWDSVLPTDTSRKAGWNTQYVSLLRAEMAEGSRTGFLEGVSHAAHPPNAMLDRSLAVACSDAAATARSTATKGDENSDVLVEEEQEREGVRRRLAS
jgi:hypothetical protein